MARGRKTLQNGRSKNTEYFTRLMHYEQNSAAYRDLKPRDRAVYLEIRRFFNGHNNGELHLSVRHAAKLCNISPNTAQKAFNSLIEHGFIKPNVKGAFSWILTQEEHNGKPATKEYLRWKPDK